MPIRNFGKLIERNKMWQVFSLVAIFKSTFKKTKKKKDSRLVQLENGHLKGIVSYINSWLFRNRSRNSWSPHSEHEATHYQC